MPALRLVVPGSLGYASGGTVYNEHLAVALWALGVAVDTVGVPGVWPVGSSGDRRRLAAALDPTVRPDQAHDAGPAPSAAGEPDAVLVDGLLACGAPDEFEAAARALRRGSGPGSSPARGSGSGPGSGPAQGARLGVLVHMSLADAPGLDGSGRARLEALERRALAAAPVVVAPSEFSARRLAERYGTAAHVARPGVVRVPLARGSLADGRAPRILCLAALVPGKGQLRLVRALGALRGLGWTAVLAGHDGADPAYARAVRDEIARLGLDARVEVPGELRGAALEAAWDRADLTVLASESETFGLSVAESLARGVPAIVGAGTGAAEALGLSLAGGLGPAGTAVGPVDAVGRPGGRDPLAVELAWWLGDASFRARWRAAAHAARPLLPDWGTTARAVAQAMGLSPSSAGS